MKLISILLAICLCSTPVYAQRVTSNYPIIQNSNTTVSGGGRILNFIGNLIATFSGGKYHIGLTENITVTTLTAGTGVFTDPGTSEFGDINVTGNLTIDGRLNIPHSTTLPATCSVGDVYQDTDATSGQRIYVCESANTWILQGDGGGVEVDPTVDTSAEIQAIIGANIYQAYDLDLTTYAGITPSANAQTLLAETFAQMQASLSIDDLVTLSGVADGSAHLATFTGTTIADNVTVKAALQALETSVETKDAVVTAGRSLTRTTNDIAADAELYTDTKCIYWQNVTADDDFKSIWRPKGYAATITSIWAESDQTVTFMLQVDDGSPADVDSVDLAPAAGVAEDTSLDGDATLADGDRLDMAITSVANTPTWCSVCWTFTRDD
jgi:hypothetical protein